MKCNYIIWLHWWYVPVCGMGENKEGNDTCTGSHIDRSTVEMELDADVEK